jgi:hypothetical protein
VGAVESAYMGPLVSLAFQSKGSKCGVGASMELQVPVCAWKWDLPQSNGAWNHASGAGGQKC